MFAKFSTFSPKFHGQAPIKVRFKKPLSSTDIAALKTQIETVYRVNFSYSGLEFDYDVVVEGSVKELTGAVNFMFPKGRPDILIQRSQF